jgi:hypothetical protein
MDRRSERAVKQGPKAGRGSLCGCALASLLRGSRSWPYCLMLLATRSGISLTHRSSELGMLAQRGQVRLKGLALAQQGGSP